MIIFNELWFVPVIFFKKVIILCALFFKFQIFSMEDVPGRLPGIIHYGQFNQAIVDFPINDLASSYRDLCRSVNKPELRLRKEIKVPLALR